MGVLDKLFGSKQKKNLLPAASFQTVTEQHPNIISWNNEMYQQQLVRATIERIAMACSKLEPTTIGSAKPRIARAVVTSPNQYMTWPKFLARCATIYYNENNLFIVPAFEPGTDIVTGIYPLKPVRAEVVEYGGEPWYRFELMTGKTIAIECRLVCLLTRFQYKSDFFGSRNILDSTLKLMHAQEQAQEQAITNGAAIRFIGALNGQVREEDMKAKRDRFTEDNLSTDNHTGMMVYDATFKDVKQVDPKSWTIDSAEMQRIREDVFFYFGINEYILTNNYTEEQWAAFYEGVVEPFAIQLGEGLSQMLYTMRERPKNRIEFSASRLQYASNATKRNMNKDMLDRGVYTINDALRVLQMPPVEDGDVRILRGEYKVGHSIEEIFAAQSAQIAAKSKTRGTNEEKADIDRDGQDADLLREDSEGYGSGGDFDTGTGGRRAD